MKISWYNKFFPASEPKQSPEAQPDNNDDQLEAQNNQGVLHCLGVGVPQAFASGLECFRQAAEQGHALAQNNLALMYSLGLGLPKDSAEARKWFLRSAEQGDAAAQYHLGVKCHRASMSPGSEAAHEAQIEAFKWFQLAADQGYWKANDSRERVNLEMTHADVAEAKRRVADFVRCKETPNSP
jgi:TPR repeat protein